VGLVLWLGFDGYASTCTKSAVIAILSRFASDELTRRVDCILKKYCKLYSMYNVRGNVGQLNGPIYTI